MEFNIDKFIRTGSFFDKAEEKVDVSWLKEHSDTVFGEDVPMYYFYRGDFTISFVYDIAANQIAAEQVEMSGSPASQTWTSYDSFVEKYDPEITAIYGDDEETVLFMRSEVNVYFNKEDDDNALAKITSRSDASRNLAISILDKIR
ncbi:hypothetical protein ACTJJ0_00685 [Chitinophaga sp. 22321]|uniref:Uncharacterized protein n=1 Tax=Chitinophaga hostae TaxID=2831022 RepID=A0ABS5IVZ0_9BACT|nr:hypothetical protein [Chitinophaga hostae]MBS0026931.1 hypothetical protein [Chitinophaga hostae]